MNRTRPQNLEPIYGVLANSGDDEGEDNRKDENKVHTIKTNRKYQVLPVIDELQWEKYKPV